MFDDEPIDRNLERELRRREERRPVEEAGGGVSEGFELAEEELIAHASHADERSTTEVIKHAAEPEAEQIDAEFGEADRERLPE